MPGTRWPHQRGPQTELFERRYGYGEVPEPGGVNSLRLPSVIGPHEFRELRNVRWEGDSVKPRGGMLLITPQLDAGADTHPWQTYDGTPSRLYMLGIGCPDIDASLGFCVTYYDENQLPVGGRATWYRDATDLGAIAVYGGQPHVAVGHELRRLFVPGQIFGEEALAQSGVNIDQPLARMLGGSTDVIRQMVPFSGFLFLFTDNGKIYAWDGLSLQLDTSGISDAKSGIVLNDDLMFIVHADGSVTYRTRGDVPGTYTPVPGAIAGTINAGHRDGLPPAVGTITSWGQNGGAAFRDAVYHAEPSDAAAQTMARIWQIDTTGATVAHTITAGAGTRCKTLVTYPGQGMFYGWGSVNWLDPVPTTSPKIGFYDGTTWTDAFNDFSANAPAPPVGQLDAIDALVFYRNRLAVLPGMYPYVSDDLLIADPNVWRRLFDQSAGWRFTLVRTALVF